MDIADMIADIRRHPDFHKVGMLHGPRRDAPDVCRFPNPIDKHAEVTHRWLNSRISTKRAASAWWM